MLFFLSGLVDATHSGSAPCQITAGVQTIGAYWHGGAGYFDGYIDQLQILFNRAKTASEILDDATLVVRYSMDCLSFPGLDSGPNGISGVANGLTTGEAGGRVGQAYLFNNTGAYFQATGFVLLGQSYRSYSFALWIRPILSVTTGGTILHVSQNNFGTGWCLPFLGLNSLGQIIAMGWNGSGVQITGPVLVVDRWIHIVETYSQTNGLRLYINGVLYGQSGSYVYASSGTPVTITLGQSLSGTTCAHGTIVIGNFRGQMDEFYSYSRELTQVDVTLLANP